MRIPALIPPRPEAAAALPEDPSSRLEAMLRQVWETAMRDLPFVNPALAVEVTGMRRLDGDWLGVAVTPWSINLVLLPGGGTLWQDVATGEHRQIAFPAGPLEFIADNSPDRAAAIPAYQYCPLIAPVQHLPDQAAAQAAAAAILQAIFEPPPAAAPEPAAERETPPRRAFLRGLLPTGR